jgi:hypothetical protein
MTIITVTDIPDADAVLASPTCISAIDRWRQTFVVASYPRAVIRFYDRTDGLPVEQIAEETVASPATANAAARRMNWPLPYLEARS